ncbi:MAG: flagellar biosynthesis protein FlhF [Burkholderiaceae bacterium]|nr:flagellar biosynthesis protein FlhF [Burkholderiaceae bacterium]
MNARRFKARSSREALMAVRQAFGDDAVVLSTRPCAEGVEVLAMAPESLQQIERVAAAPSPAAPARAGVDREREARATRITNAAEAPAIEVPAEVSSSVERDVQMLGMSTLSFQDYVRERMLRRRQAELDGKRADAPAAPRLPSAHAAEVGRSAAEPAAAAPREAAPAATDEAAPRATAAARPRAARERDVADADADTHTHTHTHTDTDTDPDTARPWRESGDDVRAEPRRASWGAPAAMVQADAAATAWSADDLRLSGPVGRSAGARPAHDAGEATEVMHELRAVRGLIEQRFGALAFMEKLQREPRQARLAQRLLEQAFSPQLVRKLVAALPDDVDESAWAASVLERNLATGEADGALEDRGGVFALVGSTGVGKTTSTAKLAAAFATRHGASQLGLVTLDAYRLGAHEQLRAYGRILGVPVHTAHDRASLEDLLELLAGKRMVLIDTAGMAQRDARTRELLEMLSHRSIQRLLVVNAASQGETIEDVLVSYRAASCKGVILAKIDEAMKLAPAVDAVIRHQLPVLAVANGQRVPEDWHRLSSRALVQRALGSGGAPAWRLDPADVNLVFAGLPAAVAAGAARAALPLA